VNKGSEQSRRGSPWRLCLVYVLASINFAGVLYMVKVLGNAEDWNTSQFAGLYGWIETSTGLGNVYAWNFWQISQNAEQMHYRARFDVVRFKPKLEGFARGVLGLTLMTWAVVANGISVATLLFIPYTMLLVAVLFCASGLLARISIAWPHIDLIHIRIGWRRKEHQLPPLSILTSVLQLWLTVMALPLVGIIPVTALYQPEFAPATGVGLWVGGMALVAFVLFSVVWRSETVRNVEEVIEVLEP
jgi:hypothetical protein